MPAFLWRAESTPPYEPSQATLKNALCVFLWAAL